MSTEKPLSTELATVANEVRDDPFYLRFAQHMLDLLFAMDIGYGPTGCAARMKPWFKQYQVEQNTHFPLGSLFNYWTMMYCKCLLRQLVCVHIYQYPLTKEQLALIDEKDIVGQYEKHIFNLKKEENITLGVIYCLKFLIGTLGKLYICYKPEIAISIVYL